MKVVKASIHGSIGYVLATDPNCERGIVDGALVQLVPAYFYSDGSLASQMCNGQCYNCPIAETDDRGRMLLRGCRRVYGEDREYHRGLLAIFDDPEQEAELLESCM